MVLTRLFNGIVNLLCACSGARPDALALVPKARAQAATLGALMVVTATAAAFTSGYAVNRLFFGESYANLLSIWAGLLWGTVVFCIDRLMIMGLDKFAPASRLVIQVITRVPLAVVIAMVMSKPFVLRASETVINTELRNQERETVNKERDA